ncbi:RICIN domain-containing protein [Couchioplanes caeruleus]|uniref:Ricin B lectin domain-containing protein n=2 Tax=Couchioplanes caeruleus TaxID=56438 RepID=A0A1K0H2Z9_9ACTN|nr:ricin-type beta-trefoil lectin domain protein [Couchioplanes caeruleus]OJF16075.1 hypothetical protein BG844_00965 [Couchioplanes caeruleus subsp. caeruleus]ROP29965.1 ricin-type beta-trefoil lectin protein [Couchioplanes caeruleus]
MRNRFWLRRGRQRAAGPYGDSGSMPMAIMVTIVGLGLTAAISPVVVNTISTTRTAGLRTESIDAATGGLDAALAQFRSSVIGPIGAEVGSLDDLPPCEIAGVDPATGLRYRATITYYGPPEEGDDESTALPLDCPPTEVPTRAVLTVTGSGVAGADLTEGAPNTRTVQATYKFRSKTQNISGGAIPLASPATNPLCMDGGENPAPGTAVWMRRCKENGSDEQRFSYTTNLNIKLMSSESTDYPEGLCLDAGSPQRSGNAVVFQKCLGRQARQQWSLDNSSMFRGTSDGVTLNNFCINAEDAGITSRLVLGGCSGATNRNVFRPEAKAGAGMASAATGQLVNFQQFSRCLDVTNHNPNWPYMIVWFCKQAPDGNVSWNQQWSLPALATSKETAVPGRIRTAGSGNPGYCLRRPDSNNGYVTMVSCPATDARPPAALLWTMYGETGNAVTRFSVVDSNNRCLSPTDLKVSSPDTHTDGTAKVIVTTCSKAWLQKWNAPPSLAQPKALSGTTEK